jgi:sigma-B regulation protein RsbU (phosphoserine phosphatase)
MLMTTVRAFLISAVEDYSDPARLMNHINKLISRDCASSGSFTTMFFLEIDPGEGTLRWIRAGHEPSLHYRKHLGQVTKLYGDGIVLGIDEAYVFETEVSDNIQPGDIILIGTDGIYETRNKDNSGLGQDSVGRIIAEHSDQSAAAIQDALMSEIRKFRGSEDQEDDITLVVIKVK